MLHDLLYQKEDKVLSWSMPILLVTIDEGDIPYLCLFVPYAHNFDLPNVLKRNYQGDDWYLLFIDCGFWSSVTVHFLVKVNEVVFLVKVAYQLVEVVVQYKRRMDYSEEKGERVHLFLCCYAFLIHSSDKIKVKIATQITL